MFEGRTWPFLSRDVALMCFVKCWGCRGYAGFALEIMSRWWLDLSFGSTSCLHFSNYIHITYTIFYRHHCVASACMAAEVSPGSNSTMLKLSTVRRPHPKSMVESSKMVRHFRQNCNWWNHIMLHPDDAIVKEPTGTYHDQSRWYSVIFETLTT